jgi:hypothetical protein
MSQEDIEHRFAYHAPNAERVQTHERIRAEIGYVAGFLEYKLPDGREKSLAITKLEEAMFWANAAIARNA